jgi:hypothetical protein
MRGYIEQMFSGTSTIFFLRDVGPFTNFTSVFLKYSLYALALVQILRIIFKKQLIFSHLFFIGILLTICCLFIIDPRTFNPRHILAIAQLTCCALALEISDLFARKGASMAFASCYVFAISFCGIFSAYEFRKIDENITRLDEGHSRLGDMDNYVNSLTGKGIHYFYALDPMQEWQIIFLSREQLIGVALSGPDRYPPYIEEVNKAFKDNKPIALTAPKWRLDKLQKNLIPCDTISNCEELSAIINPNKELLQKIRNGLQ